VEALVAASFQEAQAASRKGSGAEPARFSLIIGLLRFSLKIRNAIPRSGTELAAVPGRWIGVGEGGHDVGAPQIEDRQRRPSRVVHIVEALPARREPVTGIICAGGESSCPRGAGRAFAMASSTSPKCEVRERSWSRNRKESSVRAAKGAVVQHHARFPRKPGEQHGSTTTSWWCRNREAVALAGRRNCSLCILRFCSSAQPAAVQDALRLAGGVGGETRCSNRVVERQAGANAMSPR